MWCKTIPINRIQCLARRLEHSLENRHDGIFHIVNVDLYSGLLIVEFEDCPTDNPDDVNRVIMKIHLNDNDPVITFKQSCPEYVCEIQQSDGESIAFKFSTSSQLLRVVELINACRWKIKISDFQPLRTLGRGKFGKVVFAKRSTELGGTLPYAIKEISCKEDCALQSAWKERIVLEQISYSPSKFLVKMEYAMAVGCNAYLVMDLMRGGDLYNLLCNRGLDYSAMAFYAAEILLALEHLHSLQIVYRDLKPENILLDEIGHIKLGDFGLSKVLFDDMRAKTICGTAAYTPPEMFDKTGYSYSVDYWQYGCLVFEMFTGHAPFYHPNTTPRELKQMILAGQYTMPDRCSKRWKSLVENLVVTKVSDRIGCRKSDEGWETVKQLPFFTHLEWSDVEAQQYFPPFRPVMPGEAFIQNFDEEFTSEDPAFSFGLNVAEEEALLAERFEGFEFRSAHEIQLEATLNYHQNNMHQIGSIDRRDRCFSSNILVKTSRGASCDFSSL
mmetsp:Transcript_4485/g.5823  ORF Transcript_4485/g.5823 Transcript_4485/m.5823 type:complete len:500 (-) Transcript_4485:182-1681(-)|eukprot:CAMPEP_0117804572 /NCGR_PEP_ID=MMETSP0948-20121206/17246_1 /TAXON_ID=44440 /ORGANISM="Chattonella subsalsa, Strain CCMP2191" /LENGTH=499 /DNA_ID=CAMNT_0005638269 /DNA_START=43 /DNA_END=1542 /DNA_ORIENTATION=-